MNPPTGLRLYHYWRSTASWRVRWSLAHKGITPEFIPVNLLNGESESPAHLARNPMGYVPVLETSGRYMAESTAILEWLEETYPSPALLPADPLARAKVRALCQIINSGTQPLGNLSATEYLLEILPPDHPQENQALAKKWAQHWIRKGLRAYETLVGPPVSPSSDGAAGVFSVGDSLTLADLYLIPQCYGALRNDVPLTEFPTVARIHEAALKLPSCQASHPERFKPAT